MLKRLNGSCPLLTCALGLLILLPHPAQAQDISNLRSGVEKLHNETDALFRLDTSTLDEIWDAYCGLLDPKTKEDREYATDIGRRAQEKEKEIREQLLAGELPPLKDLARKIQQSSNADPKDKDEAKEIGEGLDKEEKKLQDLDNGLVLKGSNHPFVQYAIEYGKKQHEDMCTKFGDSSTRVCDQNFEGMDGRPDLVAIESGHLVVYEFKPDNDRAKSKGRKQLDEYLPHVVAYYQKFFKNGRTGGFDGEPDDDHKGKAMLNAIKNSPETWRSDNIEAIPVLETYRMCEKKFN